MSQQSNEHQDRLSDAAHSANTDRLLAPDEVAQWLGVAAGWVRDHACRKEPRVRSVKIGKLLRFRKEDVEAFIRTWRDWTSSYGHAPAPRSTDATEH